MNKYAGVISTSAFWYTKCY